MFGGLPSPVTNSLLLNKIPQKKNLKEKIATF
jgi:hypothetical protein